MSTLTTTTINTANGITDLTLSTGNTSAASVIVRTNGALAIKANSTLNAISINTTSITTNTASFVANGNFTANGVATLNSNTTVSASLTVANVLTVSNSAVFSTNSVTMGASSPASTGYTRLPNGFLLQWGTVTGVTNAVGTITFPATFASFLSISLTSTVNNGITAAVTSPGTVSVPVRSNSATATTFYWMAIGT